MSRIHAQILLQLFITCQAAQLFKILYHETNLSSGLVARVIKPMLYGLYMLYATLNEYN